LTVAQLRAPFGIGFCHFLHFFDWKILSVPVHQNNADLGRFGFTGECGYGEQSGKK
ncbi:MAG: hypothetical protein RIQ71_2328, partial [Verrucomicrobiota bacterium]